MSLKQYIFKFSFLYNTLSLPFLLKLTQKKSLAVFYHFVGDEKNKLTQHLYKVKSKEQFIEDIKYLKRHLTSINVTDFVNKKKKKEYSFFLSFDDGLSNFYNVVTPILHKEKVHAINFLNSDFIDNKGLFYRYKVNILIDFLLKNQLKTEQKLVFCEQLNLKEFNLDSAILNLKKININTVSKVDVLLKAIQFDTAKFLKNHQPYLTEDQIKELKSQGFQFGGHSRNHPRYTHISLKDQLEQTIQSVVKVTNTFQLESNYFSFPFSDDGVTNAFFKGIKNNVKATFGSSGIKDELIDFHYQRIQMEYDSIYTAETIIKGELLYYFFKKKVKKHITNRA